MIGTEAAEGGGIRLAGWALRGVRQRGGRASQARGGGGASVAAKDCQARLRWASPVTCPGAHVQPLAPVPPFAVLLRPCGGMLVPPMRLLPWMLPAFALLFGACSRSGGDPLLGAATIGPEGGQVEVTSGKQAGLMLAIPAGTFAQPTDVRIYDVPPTPLPPNAVPVFAASPGDQVRIEPMVVLNGATATLRLPYRPEVVSQTAPGNVRVLRILGGINAELDPVAVDVVAKRVEIRTTALGRFQVGIGPVAAGTVAYLPTLGTPIPLADGYTFTMEEVTTPSLPALQDSIRWHIVGPGSDDSLYLHDGQIVARESASAGWIETWSQPYQVWNDARSYANYSWSTPTIVSPPSGYPWDGGMMFADASWRYGQPLEFGDQTFRDVLILRLDIAWNRSDLGTGQRRYEFTFSPTVGLLVFAQDAVEHRRQFP